MRFALPVRKSIFCWQFAAITIATAFMLFGISELRANPDYFEPNVDPGVGFNLVSWGNFGSNGATVWENAVQGVYDAGFSEVSLSPIRYFDPSTGSIGSTSSSGPELSHIAAGIQRAKSLGMRVTVNPFVEPENFRFWRGQYNPIPTSAAWGSFWSDYEGYLVDVAQVAQANGADALSVGTELKAIVRNPGNNVQWNSVINAVDASFSGELGYAANWDNFANANLASTIWEHPAIDYLGIDSYFTNIASNAQADASGTHPNEVFIQQVESGWNSLLDGSILPFAAGRQGGQGLPVVLTEIGYLPYNRASVNPQNSSGAIDQDEQTMAFNGLMRAVDGRRSEMSGIHVWQWDMPGSGGSLWNLNPNGGNQLNNQQTAVWLSDFVSSAPPITLPGQTTVLYSFENSLDGFFYPNFETEPESTLARIAGTGDTDGDFSLAITKPTSPWTWDARVEMNGAPLVTLQEALLDDIENYVLEIDVTYVADELPSGLDSMDMHVSFDTSLDSWSQAFPFAAINGAVDETFTVEIPLNMFDLTAGLTSANLHLGFAGSWPGAGDATVYVDRIALTDTIFDAADGDFNGDGRTDAADFTVWRDTLGSAIDLRADGSRNGQVGTEDFDIWRDHFGAVAGFLPVTAVPEPAAMFSLAMGLLLSMRRVKGSRRRQCTQFGRSDFKRNQLRC